jgi:hypothetical protein
LRFSFSVLALYLGNQLRLLRFVLLQLAAVEEQ